MQLGRLGSWLMAPLKARLKARLMSSLVSPLLAALCWLGMAPAHAQDVLPVPPLNARVVEMKEAKGGVKVRIDGEGLADADKEQVFERVLIDVGDQKTVFTVGKDGILWKLDRKTGKYLDLTETVFQDVYERIDKKTAPLAAADASVMKRVETLEEDGAIVLRPAIDPAAQHDRSRAAAPCSGTSSAS